MTLKLKEIQRFNLELEQDLAVSRKKFMDLLQEKSKKQNIVSDIAYREMEKEVLGLRDKVSA